MYTDISGMSWLLDLWDGFINWLNSVPESSITIPSFGDITNAIFNIIGGAILGPIASATSIRLDKIFHLWDFEKITRGLNKCSKGLGIALIVVPLALDILNTWTSNNQNTVGQRFVKTGVIILNTAINVGAGFLGAAMIMGVAVNPLVAIAGLAVIYGALYLTDHIQTTVYEHFGIK